MSLLCAAGHMESSQCVWRRWQKTATATATERVAAVFWFLLSGMRSPTNIRSLGRVSFSFSISSCSCYSSFEFCTHHLVCPTAPHTDVGLQFASSFFRSSLSLSLSRHFARSTLSLSILHSLALSLPRWRSFHSCILHISSAFLFPLFDHCVCVLLSVCVCALPLPLCWLPVLLLLLVSVTKISLSSFWLPYYPMLFFSFSCFIYAQPCVCVCVKDWKSELYFCFSWLLRCTLHTFSLEDYTLHTLRSPHFPSLFLYKG